MANVPSPPQPSPPSAPPPVRPRGVPGGAGGLDAPGGRVAAALRELARELPLAVTVRGECMAPRLRDGDRVAVAPARRYWPGDIVAFHTPQGRLALHRLLGYRLAAGRLACVTQGDRCSLPDPPLAPERLLGRAAVRPTARERASAALALFALALRAAGRRLMPFAG
jgi:Peptidase S24-like